MFSLKGKLLFISHQQPTNHKMKSGRSKIQRSNSEAAATRSNNNNDGPASKTSKRLSLSRLPTQNGEGKGDTIGSLKGMIRSKSLYKKQREDSAAKDTESVQNAEGKGDMIGNLKEVIRSKSLYKKRTEEGSAAKDTESVQGQGKSNSNLSKILSTRLMKNTGKSNEDTTGKLDRQKPLPNSPNPEDPSSYNIPPQDAASTRLNNAIDAQRGAAESLKKVEEQFTKAKEEKKKRRRTALFAEQLF